VAEATGQKVGALVHPARLAVSGGPVGPSLYHMLEVLGRPRVLSRLERAEKEFGAAPAQA
jgi:glutamyl/glutaminyl-tRNA synthetase